MKIALSNALSKTLAKKGYLVSVEQSELRGWIGNYRNWVVILSVPKPLKKKALKELLACADKYKLSFTVEGITYYAPYGLFEEPRLEIILE